MKTVFTSSPLAHAWAHQTQAYGRNAKDSMSFRGPIAYSYRTPIAAIVKTVTGAPAVLFNSRKYSTTTSCKHMPPLRRATTHLQSWQVPFHRLPDAHNINLQALASEYAEARAQLMRAPAESWRLADSVVDADTYKTRAHATLSDAAAVVTSYAVAFGLPVPELNPAADADAAIARRDRILNDPARAAKREAGRKAREAAAERAAAARAERQRADDILRAARESEARRLFRAGASGFGHVNSEFGGAMLRVAAGGDDVETSWGARAPLPHVRIALKIWRLNASAGSIHDWRDIDRAHRPKLGEFTLDRIEEDGSVRAGCHTFARAELERFADSLDNPAPAPAPSFIAAEV